ncbi:dihydroorotase, partial [Candidatus Woesearchaeota archaeon]
MISELRKKPEFLLVKNALSPRYGKLEKAWIIIKNDRIKNISFKNQPRSFLKTADSDRATLIDADGGLLLPGAIDPHVHLREPGMTHKEDFETGSRAAAAGGITTVLDMPNTKPPVFTLKELQLKRTLARGRMMVNYGFYMGARPADSSDRSVIKKICSEIKKAKNVPGTKIYMDETTGNHIISDEKALERIFRASRLVAVHAESANVKKAIAAAKSARKKLYCCHISTSKEISYIAEAKMKQKVYCEVTPHHLFLSEEDYTNGFRKMKPPLRSRDNVDSLWEAIRNGIVDTIGTDHAPHTLQEKKSDNPPYGVPGLETMMPLVLTAARDGAIDYESVKKLTSQNAAKIFRMRGRGILRKNFFADISIYD